MEVLELIVVELEAGLGDAEQVVRSLLRLLIALLCGAIIGLERERVGKPAGLRTHILVAVGSALILVASAEIGMDESGLSRVIQGLVTGIGFLGAGAILKRTRESDIRGLTTAAGIWMTCAIGICAGLGRFGVALFGTLFAWTVMSILHQFERDETATCAADGTNDSRPDRAASSTSRKGANLNQGDGHDQ